MNEAARAPFSVRRRLLVAVLGTLACVWLAIAVYSYFDARHEIGELLDAHLAQSASMIVAQAGGDPGAIELEHAPQLHRRTRKVAFQIWDRGKVLRLHSANAPDQRFSARDEGFSDVTIAGQDWRVFSSWDARRRYLVQVGERASARREIASHVARNLLMPLLLALPLLGLLIWGSISGALRPLARLGDDVAARRADDLSPLPPGGVPQEAAPLVANLNTLFARVGAVLEDERRFTADAAHELRTPLAALKAQAQVARAASDGTQRNRALDNVIAGCDRAARLVEQLLTLARLSQGPAPDLMQQADLRDLAREAVAALAPGAIAKRVDLGLEAPLPAVIHGHPGLLDILLRNVVDNAVRYSRAGGAVSVGVCAKDGWRTVTVIDQGPGIAPQEREQVGRRFYRILGSVESGSGLGLSIAKRIAEIHGASLSLETPEGGAGLCVRVAFPAPTPP